MKQNIAPLVFLLASVVPYVFADDEEGEDEEEKDWSKHWKAHGICASIAWAILVPLAIGSSVCRNTFEKAGFHESSWFTIHFTLNTIAALLTAAAFGIAVYIIRSEDGRSTWTEYPHFIVGLVVFILTMLQALVGMFRPHHAAPTKEEPEHQAEEENEETVTEEKVHAKSTPRVLWEAKHRLVGVSCLGMAWYQIYSGWELFEEEVGGEDMGKAWLGVGGGLVGVVVLLKVFTMVRN
jgi:cytochrome bd-type quinol oxidase subunit 2